MRARKLPLRIHVATLVALLVLLVGLILAAFQHRENSRILIEATRGLMDQFAIRAQLTIQRTTFPLRDSLLLLGKRRFPEANTQAQRDALLPDLVLLFQVHPNVARLGLVYPDGYRLHITHRPGGALKQGHEVEYLLKRRSVDGAQQRRWLDPALKPLANQPEKQTVSDQRTMPWYRQVIDSQAPAVIAPELSDDRDYHNITFALPCANQACVITAEFSVQELSVLLEQLTLKPNSVILVLDERERIIAYRAHQHPLSALPAESIYLNTPQETGSSLLRRAFESRPFTPGDFQYAVEGTQWTTLIRQVNSMSNEPYYLALVAPRQALIAEAWQISRTSGLITLIVLLLALVVVWWIAQRIAKPLQGLTEETRDIEALDFSRGIETHSFISEIDSLAASMGLMKKTIGQFLDLVSALSQEQNFARLQTLVSRETRIAGQADAAVLYLVDAQEQLIVSSIELGQEMSVNIPDLGNSSQLAPVRSAFEQGQTQAIVLTAAMLTGSEYQPIATALTGDQLILLAIPLFDRQHNKVGLLSLVYTGDKAQIPQPGSTQIAFIEAISGFAALSLESQQNAELQKALLESFIKLIAGAIDAKSPYTGGHCQRVPELTKMLARAACHSDQVPFTAFSMGEEQWEALHIAAWMHDCGKVTTPEYVVDKATKLETLNNRIHEIRTRFEVLKRDAQIRYWQQKAEGNTAPDLEQQLQHQLAQLDDDYAFVARCNNGDHPLTDADLQRLDTIAGCTWQRTLDDNLGLSWEEAQRKPPDNRPLPVAEPLLADKPEHRIAHTGISPVAPDNPWGFKMDMPACLYDRGELHNLKVAKGTLTAEERFKINEHIIQTIIMLEKLPYPRHLRDIPAIAGGHHEKMDGSGYPRRLKREQMTLTARMMAIADIFEALTASDRPYKAPKKLSDAIAIMHRMSQEAHVDKELFDLFLRQGIYRDYAERFLAPEQIDEVDVSRYLEGGTMADNQHG